jgi:hypothetical protein
MASNATIQTIENERRGERDDGPVRVIPKRCPGALADSKYIGITS